MMPATKQATRKLRTILLLIPDVDDESRSPDRSFGITRAIALHYVSHANLIIGGNPKSRTRCPEGLLRIRVRVTRARKSRMFAMNRMMDGISRAIALR